MTSKMLPPIGHLWTDDDNPVVAIDPARPQVLPGLDLDTLRCPVCGAEPIQRRDPSGRLLYVAVFHGRPCARLSALYADPRTGLYEP